MNKLIFSFAALAAVLFTGCVTLPNEKTEICDVNKEEVYTVSFSRENDLSFYILHVNLLEEVNPASLNGIKVLAENSTDNSVKIKAVMENEFSEIVAESVPVTIEAGKEETVVFNFYQLPEEDAETNVVSFYIEGKLNAGSISLGNMEFIQ
ncbi:MAG: hypothetical protein UHY90_06295 [Treponema sp.]|nr:hypothetical protein [Spirochaetia bacterium]MDD7460691.1 hypothetical protein [Spirochaetales bacterium]MDY5812015.1 hypothetical protein [Treponema sp.]MEE1181846.1 hypothetical protein [Treponema sp.]